MNKLRNTVLALAVAAGQAAAAPLSQAEADLAGWATADLHPAPLLNGGTLVAAGHRPGPGFKAALDAVEDAQLEGRVTDEAAALALAEATLRAATESP